MKVLAVDDDPELLPLVAFVLRQGGYLVVEAPDARRALDAFESEKPDLVVLDVNLPDLDGFEVCRRIRAVAETPILMLTVRADESDVVRGLDLGADDYLTKPFSPRTLLARVRALLRRAGKTGMEASLAAGDLDLDLERHTLRIRGAEPLSLAPLELRLLQILLAQPGRTVSPERLIRHLWGTSVTAGRDLLKQVVYRLRQRIEPDPSHPTYLLTDPGAGYRLETG